jgi:hypothetical protein
MSTNLPNTDNSSEEMKTILNRLYSQEVSFPSNQIDAVLGFFLKRGFSDQAAKSISITLLNQSREDNVNVFILIDKLKQLSDAQLTQMITEVVNTYRDNTSMLGYRTVIDDETMESRNIRT